MFKVEVIVTLRTSILDPQGKTVEHAMHSLRMNTINNVRVGKVFHCTINTSSYDEAKKSVEEACKKVFTNPVMEDYSYKIEKM